MKPQTPSRTPIVGDVVWYTGHKLADGSYNAQPWPATVVRVDGDGLLTLFVMNTATFFQDTAPYSATVEPGTWRWPDPNEAEFC